MSREKAIDFFSAMNEDYKADIIRDIPEGEVLSLYEQDDFIDLCRGPHVASTGRLIAFKLTKVAGAYWRGDHNNPMLQRIYGTAWATEKQLKEYLYRIEEAKKRDHRLIAQKMDLFHIEEHSPGMVFWHPNGWELYQNIVHYVRRVNKIYGYKEISTPQILDKLLWVKSGHWEKFHENMYTTVFEEKEAAVKPMSCPGHLMVFNQGLRSYKELPIKFSEFGSCHRKEPSGSLHGLMRVRNLLQDDGHIFCTEEQIKPEVASFISEVYAMYKDFGFSNVLVKLSTRPEKRVGADEVWDKAEQALQESLDESGVAWELQEGEGAFYGPKIEFVLQDCLARLWQCGTIQLDFSLPERLGASYVDADNSKKIPVMLHRAVLGSVERFIGILIEEYEGYVPLWLAPVQIVVANITENQVEYVNQVFDKLSEMGFRAKVDMRNENIGYKIREHSIARVPYILVCGDKEVSSEKVAVRGPGGENKGVMILDDFISEIEEQLLTLADKTKG